MIILVAKAKQRAIRSRPISAQLAKSTTRPKQVRSVRRQRAIRICFTTWKLAAKTKVRANVSVLRVTVRSSVAVSAMHSVRISITHETLILILVARQSNVRNDHALGRFLRP